MTSKEQNEQDAKMQKLHAEFYAAWRNIRTKLPAVTPALEQAAWLGFLAGVDLKP